MVVLTVDIPPTAVLSTGFMDFYGHDYRLVRQGDPRIYPGPMSLPRVTGLFLYWSGLEENLRSRLSL